MIYKGLVVTAFLFLFGCGGSGGGVAPLPSTQPLAQGARVLGMDVKEVPSVTYALAYDQAIAVGVREVSVSLDWASLEPTEGNYDNTWPGTIEAYTHYRKVISP